MTRLQRLWQYALKWEALKLSFAVGCIFGMLGMAVLMTAIRAGVDVTQLIF